MGSSKPDDDEVEELLVEDFDGQCSRTYPDNHSRIVRWRASKIEERKLVHGDHASSESNNKSSDVISLSTAKETASDVRCRDWSKTDQLEKNSTNGSDTKTLINTKSVVSDHERDLAAKKRRLMNSSSLDHSKSTSTLTTESSSTGMHMIKKLELI